MTPARAAEVLREHGTWHCDESPTKSACKIGADALEFCEWLLALDGDGMMKLHDVMDRWNAEDSFLDHCRAQVGEGEDGMNDQEHICGDPNGLCDAECMDKAHMGEVLRANYYQKQMRQWMDAALQVSSERDTLHSRIAELEAALAEEKERWIQEREAWIERQAECVTLREALEEARKDNEELDGTDAAHPAWWRGQDYGADSICRALTKVLDGKEPAGTCGEPYEKLRRRVWEAREDAARYQYIRTEAMIDYCTGSKRHNRISWPTIYAAEPSDGGNYRDRFDAAIDAAREAKP